MFSLKSRIGTKSDRYLEELTTERVSAFCQAVGATGQGAPFAPPTFMTVFRKGEFELFQKLGIPLSKILHAEQEYQYETPLRTGDRVGFETTLSQVLEKHSGSHFLQFLTFETSFQVERKGVDRLISAGKSQTTIVIRDRKEEASP